MVTITLKKTEHFHRNKGMIPRVVLLKTGSKEIIYGARALNKQLPKFLHKPTQDFDIFSPTPKKDANQVEKALDKSFGGDFFFVEPAKHEGTWKVKSHINQEGYVDYTKPKNKIPSKKIGNKRYIKLSYVKKHIKKTLKDPEAKYRHAKDKDALNRIKISEKTKSKTERREKRKHPFGWGVNFLN